MSDPRQDPLERLHELLAELELGRLDAAERAELDALLESDALLAGAAQARDVDDTFEAVAADLALTHAALCAPGRESLPAHLAERVRADAARHFGWSAPAKGPANGSVAPRTQPERARASWSAQAGWLLAAAAALALAVLLTGPDERAEETRDEFIARVDDEIVVPWKPTEDPLGSGVAGDVVWSPSEQKGYMRFTGLDVNDPSANQYQLWIIDGTRVGEDPVDGGVFDCSSSGEIVVPIDAKLAVGQPAAFAITLEKPGGVVVSKQEHLFLLAAVGS